MNSQHDRAVVMASGGLDSTVALHWAIREFEAVRAISFSYGQPAAARELSHAAAVASRLGIDHEIVSFGGLCGGILHRVCDESGTAPRRLSSAFVPARNLVFLSFALSQACAWWPLHPFAIVVGACADDVAFPDCSGEFFDIASRALSSAVSRRIDVCAPFVRLTKAGVCHKGRELGRDALRDLLGSWSCYRGGEYPCNHCLACIQRARALAEL